MRFIVQKGGHDRYLKTGVRNVHAWVEGMIVSPEKYCQGLRIYYNLSSGAFVNRNGYRVHEADLLQMHPWGMTGAGLEYHQRTRVTSEAP